MRSRHINRSKLPSARTLAQTSSARNILAGKGAEEEAKRVAKAERDHKRAAAAAAAAAVKRKEIICDDEIDELLGPALKTPKLDNIGGDDSGDDDDDDDEEDDVWNRSRKNKAKKSYLTGIRL